MSGLPYMVVGPDELGGPVGVTAACPNCGAAHDVRYGERVLPDGTRVPSKLLAFVRCGDHSYIVGIGQQVLA